MLRYVLGQWNLQPDRDVALIQMGGSPETLAGLAAGAIDGGLLASPLHLQAAKFGYQFARGLEHHRRRLPGRGCGDDPKLHARGAGCHAALSARLCRGLAPIQDRQEFRGQSDRQVSRITDPEALEETYQHYAVKVMPRVPYPTIKGIQMVLDEIGSRTPKAKSLTPESFIDMSYLKELEQSGFIKKLYGE